MNLEQNPEYQRSRQDLSFEMGTYLIPQSIK